MALKKQQRKGYGKLLDAWDSPENVGEPVGCVATTFTFDPVLFEEECLSRFLNMQTDAAEDGAAFLIEREEKLSAVQCAAVLVDQRHCQGSRNLRWDLLPARFPQGILHAKISILRWAQAVRLIIGSANLTEDGFRKNQEIFGILDYHPDSEAPLSCLTEVAQFMRDVVQYVRQDADQESDPAVERWVRFLGETLDQASEWGSREDVSFRKGGRVHPVLIGPGRKSALEQMKGLWPGTLPTSITVTSPFFDRPDAPNKPANEIWSLFRQRGETALNYQFVVEETPDHNQVLLRAPESLRRACPRDRQKRHITVSRHHGTAFERERPRRNPTAASKIDLAGERPVYRLHDRFKQFYQRRHRLRTEAKSGSQSFLFV